MVYKPLSSIGTTLLEKIANYPELNVNTKFKNFRNRRSNIDYKKIVNRIEEKLDPNKQLMITDNDIPEIREGLKKLKENGFSNIAEHLGLQTKQRYLESVDYANKKLPPEAIKRYNSEVEKFNNKKHVSHLEEDELNYILHKKHNPGYNKFRIHFDNNGNVVGHEKNVTIPKILSKAKQEDRFGAHNVRHVDFSETNTIFGYHPENIKALDSHNYLNALKDIHKNHIGLVKAGANKAIKEKYLAKKYLFIKNRPAGVSDDDIRRVLGNNAIVDKKYGRLPGISSSWTTNKVTKYENMSPYDYNNLLNQAKEEVKKVIKTRGFGHEETDKAMRRYRVILNSAPDKWSSTEVMSRDNELNAIKNDFNRRSKEMISKKIFKVKALGGQAGQRGFNGDTSVRRFMGKPMGDVHGPTISMPEPKKEALKEVKLEFPDEPKIESTNIGTKPVSEPVNPSNVSNNNFLNGAKKINTAKQSAPGVMGRVANRLRGFANRIHL